MSDFEFKPEDFETKDTECFLSEKGDSLLITEIANTILKEWLDKAPTWYELENCPGVFLPVNKRRDYGVAIKQAKLVCIEEIK